MTDSIGWGILGTGWIAELFTQDLQMAGHRVAAVGSRRGETADAFAKRFAIPHAHASYDVLVADPSVDIIYVATPHPMHAANALSALDAGKHVLIEKPFTLNARQAHVVVERAAQNNLLVLEAMWTRFLPHMVRIREIVKSGVLGEIRAVSAFHAQDLSDDPAHRLNALELGGGALLDLGIYPISFTWDILGAPKTIQASARFKQTGADSQVATIFGYENGALATTFSASDAAGPNTAAILGTEGRIEIDSIWYAPTTFRHYAGEAELVETYHTPVAGRGMQFQAARAERLIRAGLTSSPILPSRESAAIMETLDTIRARIGLQYPGE